MKTITNISVFLLIYFASQNIFAVTNYVSKTGAHVSPFTSWANAANNIQDAVDVATNGDTVLVNDGIYDSGETVTPGYSCLNRVVITNDITVKSVNGPEKTIILGNGPMGNNAVRGVYMSTGILDGFTVSNGHTLASGDWAWTYDESGGGVNMYGGNGVVTNCTISGNYADVYSGGTMDGTVNNCTISGNSAEYGGGTGGGTINNCTITGNSAEYGGGTGSSTVNNSTISGNSATSFGGGTFYGTVNNCTITGNSAEYGGGTDWATINNCTISGNSAGSEGGGTYDSTVNNCTISGNSAGYDGGGTYDSTVNNCIIYFNYAASSPNHNYSTIKFSCTTPLPFGEGNISQNPKLIDNAHIATNSPCIGAGSSAFVSGVDIDGDDWAIPPAIGCDQPVAGICTGKLSVTLFAKYKKIATDYKNYFYGSIIGRASHNRLSFDNGDSWPNSLGGYYSWGVTGTYKVILTAFNENYPAGISATTIVEIVEKQTHYADKNNSNPVFPYTSLSTAATNIQNAVDFVNHGDSILVNDGIYNIGGAITPGYSCSNRVVITKDIIVKSLNGPEKTIILGKEPLGNSAVRGVYMSTGILDGFTISNGHTMTSGDVYYDRSGGGVNMFGGNGIVTNCTISGNSAIYDGGGAIGGTINNCTISGNSAIYDGGGAIGGTINNCTINGNSAGGGGGTYKSTVNNSTINGNSAGNSGGGMYKSTVNNSTINGNSAGNSGGGMYKSTVNNSTIIGNSAHSGGGTFASTVNNCTINGNSAHSGGGTCWSIVNNCIIWDNFAPNGTNFFFGDGSISYSCSYPLPSGEGNISNNPQFVSSSDFHLQPTSPCINAGTNAFAPMPFDLDGNPRIVNGIVDMGCYEANSTRASPIFADAATLPSDYDSADGSNTNAITEPGEPAHAGYGPFHSVWWDWKSPSSSMFSMKSNASGGDVLLVDTHGSDFDTVLAVYTGSVISNLTEIAANDDAGPGTNTSEVIFGFISDETYHIAVAGKTESDVGNIVLHYEIIPEPCLFIIYNLLIVIYYWRRGE